MKLTKMKNIKGQTLFVIGMVMVTLGLTILNDFKSLQYTVVFSGLLLSVFSVFLSANQKKRQKE